MQHLAYYIVESLKIMSDTDKTKKIVFIFLVLFSLFAVALGATFFERGTVLYAATFLVFIPLGSFALSKATNNLGLGEIQKEKKKYTAKQKVLAYVVIFAVASPLLYYVFFGDMSATFAKVLLAVITLPLCVFWLIYAIKRSKSATSVNEEKED